MDAHGRAHVCIRGTFTIKRQPLLHNAPGSGKQSAQYCTFIRNAQCARQPSPCWFCSCVVLSGVGVEEEDEKAKQVAKNEKQQSTQLSDISDA